MLYEVITDPVGGLESYRKMVAKSPRGQMVSVLVNRDGGQMYLAFRTR